MCCFSSPVHAVAATSIFARPLAAGRQALAYAMAFSANQDLALVLPLPVAAGAGEDAVEWLDLSACRDLFERLDRAFPKPPVSRSSGELTLSAHTLRVVRVGAFEASFVPTAADMQRLDPRFSLPAGVLQALPARRGFVVARLHADATQMHPLAFTFPRADAASVFFPTVHAHDGHVHRTAHFDHTLLLQAEALPPATAPGVVGRVVDAARNRIGFPRSPGRGTWEIAAKPIAAVLDPAKTAGLVAPALPLVRLRLRGEMTNEDVCLPLS